MSRTDFVTTSRAGLALLLGAALLATTACGTVVRPIAAYHGYLLDKEKIDAIEMGKDTKATLTQKLGSPSSTGTFDPNVWYYISHTDKSFAFFDADTVRRDIVEIHFNDDGKVATINRYDVKDGNRIAYAGKETPTRGRELGFWEQMFGNVGRGIPGQAGQQQQPGQRR